MVNNLHIFYIFILYNRDDLQFEKRRYMEQQFAGPEGLSNLFRFLQYLEYMPFIAIGLLAATIIFWVVFGIMKLRWIKRTAITFTVLIIIASLLSLVPYVLEDSRGDQFQDLTPEEREQLLKDQRGNESSFIEKLMVRSQFHIMTK